MTGEPALVDLDEESDSEEQDFESWKPDPVDADPSKAIIIMMSNFFIAHVIKTTVAAKTSRSRQTSDIIRLQ